MKTAEIAGNCKLGYSAAIDKATDFGFWLMIKQCLLCLKDTENVLFDTMTEVAFYVNLAVKIVEKIEHALSRQSM